MTLTEHAVFEYDLKTKTIYEQSGLEQYGIMSPSLSEVPESVISEGYVHPQDAPAMRKCTRKFMPGKRMPPVKCVCAAHEMQRSISDAHDFKHHLWGRR